MRTDDPNRQLLILIADALGDLREQLVFVGGCAAGLLVTDPAASDIRPTTDVDAVVEASSFVQFATFEALLPARGFVADEESGIRCRWKHRDSGTLFDLMSVDPAVLGFSNPWYPEAFRTAEMHTLREGLSIRMMAAPAFLATKLEAYVNRGRRDYLSSKDLEDVLIVVDGRPLLADEMLGASPELRAGVQRHLNDLLADPNFEDALPGLVDSDSPSEGRWELVLERLKAIASGERAPRDPAAPNAFSAR